MFSLESTEQLLSVLSSSNELHLDNSFNKHIIAQWHYRVLQGIVNINQSLPRWLR